MEKSSEISNQSDISKSEERDQSHEEGQLTSATTQDVPEFGWSAYAERVNGRFAMIGFAAVLLIELLSRDTFLNWAGLIP